MIGGFLCRAGNLQDVSFVYGAMSGIVHQAVMNGAAYTLHTTAYMLKKPHGTLWAYNNVADDIIRYVYVRKLLRYRGTL